MRKLLFRAKRLDNGEWVEGHYFTDAIYTWILWGFLAHKVDPSTVGQFTGETDVDGVEIFEGDRIEEGVVEWSDKYGGWFVDEDKPLYDIPLPVVIVEGTV